MRSGDRPVKKTGLSSQTAPAAPTRTKSATSVSARSVRGACGRARSEPASFRIDGPVGALVDAGRGGGDGRAGGGDCIGAEADAGSRDGGRANAGPGSLIASSDSTSESDPVAALCRAFRATAGGTGVGCIMLDPGGGGVGSRPTSILSAFAAACSPVPETPNDSSRWSTSSGPPGARSLGDTAGGAGVGDRGAPTPLIVLTPDDAAAS